MAGIRTLFFVHQRAIVASANRARLPAIYSHTDFTRPGGLMAYAADLVEMSRRAGAYVDKILKGAHEDLLTCPLTNLRAPAQPGLSEVRSGRRASPLSGACV